MLNFINKKQDFIEETIKKKLVFNDTLDFVSNPFLPGFGMFIAFEFDKVYTQAFYQGIMRFLCHIKNERLTFYTIDPSPVEYFLKNFLNYSVIQISLDTSYNDYIEILARDPGGSPADALLYNAERISLYSDDAQWGLIGSKDVEIGIVGFKNNEVKNIFISSFDNTTFTDISTRIQELENMLDIDEISRNLYSEIKSNYR